MGQQEMVSRQGQRRAVTIRTDGESEKMRVERSYPLRDIHPWSIGQCSQQCGVCGRLACCSPTVNESAVGRSGCRIE